MGNHSGIPVALLDIKNPASLAALNFMGNILELHNFYSAACSSCQMWLWEPSNLALGFSRRSAAGFGFAGQPICLFDSSNTSGRSLLPSSAGPILATVSILALADSTHLRSLPAYA